MTEQELNAVIDWQLARDLGLSPSVWERSGTQVYPWTDLPGRRRYREGDPFLLGHIRRGTAVFAVHPCLLSWAEAHLPAWPPEWCLDYRYLRQLDDALRPWGWTLHNAHPFFAPDLSAPPAVSPGPVVWFEGDALEQFRGDPRWEGTLAFQPLYPDQLAVAALGPIGQLAGMAAASRDGERLWQIGVNVLPAARGRRIASALTALLKEELLRRGIVPFYGTAQSHIFSLNTARRAGFRPAWAEVYARPV